jgi:hypothetical protein
MRLRSWLSSCNTEHAQCSTKEQVPLPTRLLALSSLPDADDMACINNERDTWCELFQNATCRLVENRLGTMGQYVALSYCWGLSLPYITATDNLEQHLHEIVFARLPRTLQDSIMIARFSGFDYIWIDCLCILQDDKEDWGREAARMDDVYSNAALTLAAS